MSYVDTGAMDAIFFTSGGRGFGTLALVLYLPAGGRKTSVGGRSQETRGGSGGEGESHCRLDTGKRRAGLEAAQ